MPPEQPDVFLSRIIARLELSTAHASDHWSVAGEHAQVAVFWPGVSRNGER